MCHLRTANADIDRATTNQWLNTSSFKGQTEDFILAGQDQSISTRACQSRILNNGALILTSGHAQCERKQ